MFLIRFISKDNYKPEHELAEKLVDSIENEL